MSSNELKFTATNRGDWDVGIFGYSIGIKIIIEDSDQEYFEEIKTDLDRALSNALNNVMKDFYEAEVTSELEQIEYEKNWRDNDE